MKSFKRVSLRLTLRLSVKLCQVHKLPKWNKMKQRNIRNVLGLICPNPKPPHGVVVDWVSSVNPISTRVYRPQQLVDCQVSTFSDQARDHGLPGVSPGIPPLQNLWRFVLFHGWQSGMSCDKEKLELASKIVRLPGCHNKSLLLNWNFAHLFSLHFIITFYI